MGAQKKSICFISPFMGPLLAKTGLRSTGGAERQFFFFGQELAKRGWRVSFVADCGACRSGRGLGDWDVFHVPFAFLKGNRWRLPQDAFRLFLALRRAEAQYVVLKTAHVLLLPILLYTSFYRRKFVFWGQTSTDFDLKKGNEGAWLRQIRFVGIRRAAHVVVQTRDQLKALRANFGRQGVHVPNITITYPGAVDAVEMEDNYVFWCGNATANKRPLVFVELARQIPERRFVMAMNPADGELYERVRMLCGELPNVLFLGSVPEGDICRWFAKAGVFVNTSVREGFPNTFLQAWEQGVAVVSLCVNPDGVLNNPSLGVCVYAHNEQLQETDDTLADRLALDVRKLLQVTPGDRSSADTRRQYVLRNHSPAAVIGQLLTVLDERVES